MRRRLIAGNWKMNGRLDTVRSLCRALRDGVSATGEVELAVLPPAVYLPAVADLLAGSAISWGGQDVSVNGDDGAYTGEISAAMLADLGARWALVGHSERRTLHGESDDLVAGKFMAARQAGLTPVFCLGETLAEREAGATEAVVGRQLTVVMKRVGIAALADAVIAYEPVWAIGTGKTASPEQAQAVHAFIRSQLALADANIAGSIRILYGGSMKPENAGQLLAQPDIDGGLIGGASLQADAFLAIAASAG